MTFTRVAIIGLGLLGGSIGLALREYLAHRKTSRDYDKDWEEHMKRSQGAPPA